MDALENIDLLISTPGVLSFLSLDWESVNLSGRFTDKLTFVLWHFVWQGLLVALTLNFVLEFFRSAKSTTRYAFCSVAMLAMLLLPVFTFFMLPEPTSSVSEISATSALNSELKELDLSVAIIAEKNSTVPLELTNTYSPLHYVESSFQYLISPLYQKGETSFLLQSYYKYLHPVIPLFWGIGIILFAARYLCDLKCACRFSKTKKEAPSEWMDVSRKISNKLNLGSTPKIYLTDDTCTAMAIGIFKPIVLIPSSWLLNMPAESLEAIIAHEIAHIKRWDLWFILIQRFMEIVLFFHPAVWWLSSELREQREMCCDDLAVLYTGSKLKYAETLEKVAILDNKRRKGNSLHAVSFLEKKAHLTNRIYNILGNSSPTKTALWKPFLLMGIIIFLNYGIRSAASVHPHDKDQKVNSSTGLESPTPHASSLSAVPSVKSGDIDSLYSKKENANPSRKNGSASPDNNSGKISENEIGRISFEKNQKSKTDQAHTQQLEGELEQPTHLNNERLQIARKRKSRSDSMAKFKMMTIPLKAIEKKDWLLKNAPYIKVPVDLNSLAHSHQSSHAQSLLDNSVSDEILPDMISRIVHTQGAHLFNEGVVDLPEKPVENNSSIQDEAITSWFLSYIEGRRYLFKFKIRYSSKWNSRSWNIETHLLKGDSQSSEVTHYHLNENEGLLQVFPLPEHDIAILVYTQHPAHLRTPAVMK
jgi:beta-lactamase regulating signal transducer with metallopeptidase domain